MYTGSLGSRPPGVSDLLVSSVERHMVSIMTATLLLVSKQNLGTKKRDGWDPYTGLALWVLTRSDIFCGSSRRPGPHSLN